MRANVRLLVDVDANDVSDAEIDRSLQYAYNEAIGDEQWPFLLARATFNTVGGTEEYASAAIAADLEAHRITQVMAGGIVLAYVPPEHYFQLAPYGQTTPSSGPTPSRWTILQVENLALWPEPASIFSVQVVYAILPAALDDDADVPLMPSRYHQHLEAGAAVLVYQKIGDFESAEVKKKEFADGIDAMRGELLRPQRQSPLIYGGGVVTRGLPERALMPWELPI